jgi:hypothetical protein
MQLSRIHATLRAHEFTIFISVSAEKSLRLFRGSCIRVRLDADHGEMQHCTDAADRRRARDCFRLSRYRQRYARGFVGLCPIPIDCRRASGAMATWCTRKRRPPMAKTSARSTCRAQELKISRQNSCTSGCCAGASLRFLALSCDLPANNNSASVRAPGPTGE